MLNVLKVKCFRSGRSRTFTSTLFAIVRTHPEEHIVSPHSHTSGAARLRVHAEYSSIVGTDRVFFITQHSESRRSRILAKADNDLLAEKNDHYWREAAQISSGRLRQMCEEKLTTSTARVWWRGRTIFKETLLSTQQRQTVSSKVYSVSSIRKIIQRIYDIIIAHWILK